MKITECPNGISVTDFGEINLDLTLDCGQCFRWKKDENGVWSGIAYEKAVRIEKSGDALVFYGASGNDVENIWADYFDLKRDYSKYLQELSKDGVVRESAKKFGTVRILRQEPWETLCSFIISSCNNIPRIKLIIERFCRAFGSETENGIFSFPSAEVTSKLTADDMKIIGAGFRAPYITEAAERVASDSGFFRRIMSENENDARKELMTLRGVGKKVADCTMLFSLGFDSVFPTDTHVLQAVRELYPTGLPECFSAFPGLAQQYVFYKHLSENQHKK